MLPGPGRGRDGGDGRVDHRPPADGDAAEYVVCAVDNLLADSGLDRLRRRHVLRDVLDRDALERRDKARGNRCEPARAGVGGQHSGESLAVRVGGVPQPALLQDQGVDTELAEPQCRHRPAIAAADHDGRVVAASSGSVQIRLKPDASGTGSRSSSRDSGTKKAPPR